MSVQVLDGGDVAALYCDTDGVAFGPTFDSAAHAADFCSWLRDEHTDAVMDRARGVDRGGWFHSADPRKYTALDLSQHHQLWRSERTDKATGELLPPPNPPSSFADGTMDPRIAYGASSLAPGLGS